MRMITNLTSVHPFVVAVATVRHRDATSSRYDELVIRFSVPV